MTIDLDIASAIEVRLAEIERRERVRILYACESGSRAWGFPSADSDYDVRFLYLHERDWYLRIDADRVRDVIECPIEGLLDINGWDLKKALRLLYKSNPALLEWIHSPIRYRADVAFHARLRQLAQQYYRPRACFHHYAHMASGNFREYLQGERVRVKKYFYVLRPVLAMRWIEQGRGIVPMAFSVLVDELLPDGRLRQDIDALLDHKRRGFEAEFGPRIESTGAFIETELERLTHKAESLGQPEHDLRALNEFFLSLL
jgi:predicted nucleotidyltransferase